MTDTVSHLRRYLVDHQNYGSFISFVAAFSEAIPLLGSVVPGSIIMIGIGVLIGAGVLQVDRALSAGFSGAISGDVLSFCFGYFFFREIKEYSVYNKLYQYISLMENMLTKHTILTTIVGRFVGPARSALPFVAGTLFINPFIFLPVSMATSCTWVFLYTMPGIFSGVTGATIPPELTIKYFLFGGVFGFCSSISVYLLANRFSGRKQQKSIE